MTGEGEAGVIGVLLMAYGTPRNLAEVEPFYIDIRGGRRPSPELIENLRNRYRSIGGKTPLTEISRAQARALEEALGQGYRVYLGMKHWHPYIKDAVGRMAEEGVRRAVAMALAPHFSALSVGGYFRAIEEAQDALDTHIEFERVRSWHLQPDYLRAVADRVRARMAEVSPDVIIFTAHSLPRRILDMGDPYVEQLQATSQAVAQQLGLAPDRWTFSFQSAGATGDAWLGPDILGTIARLAGEGAKLLLAAPVGFISDHLEILYDLDVQAAQHAQSLGVELRRTESLNADPLLIQGLAAAVRERLLADDE
ncbi:MAG: ferrochelatase [Chloroflexota bacterium]